MKKSSIVTHFDAHNLLSPSQYGFRQNHSTEHAIISIIDKITEKLDSHHFITGIFLDLSKAFDTINHDILIDKLKYYGIRNKELELIRNYLHNRKQCTQYNDTISDLLSITHGIPQGSILGPLLFIIYINDIASVSDTLSSILFADDTNVLSYDYNQKELLNNINSDLNKIDDWLKANKLSLNIEKTENVIFATPQRKRYIEETLKTNISIRNTNIKPVSQTNFLGTIITDTLNWEPFFNKQAMKANKGICMLSYLKYLLPHETLTQIYYAIVLPHLQYGITAWGAYLNGENKLEILQKKAIRNISKSEYNAHTEHLFSKYKILKLKDVYQVQVAKFIFNFKQNNLPKAFDLFIDNAKLSAENNTAQIVGLQHDHNNARPVHTFPIPSITRRNTLRIACYKIWEKLPTDLINFNGSINTFKHKLKLHFLETYPKNKTCHIRNCYSCDKDSDPPYKAYEHCHYYKYITNEPPYDYNTNELNLDVLYKHPNQKIEIEYLLKSTPKDIIYYDTLQPS